MARIPQVGGERVNRNSQLWHPSYLLLADWREDSLEEYASGVRRHENPGNRTAKRVPTEEPISRFGRTIF